MPELQVTQETLDPRTSVIKLRGELDVATASELAEPLRDSVAQGRTAIVLDLLELTFLDSAGLMVLVTGLRMVLREHGSLVLVCTNPTVLRVFDITRMNSTFTIVPTREQALATAAG